MTWIHISKAKPAEGQRVLVYCPKLAEHDRGHDTNAPGIRIGHYIAGLNHLRPDFSCGFNAEWWMPLPDAPVKARKRKAVSA